MRNGAVRGQAAADDKHGSAHGKDLTLVKRGKETMRQVRDWRDTIAREAKERPGRSAAIALAAGYVLGGGLFSALTGRIVGTGLRLGFRLALVPLLSQSLISMGENLMNGKESSS